MLQKLDKTLKRGIDDLKKKLKGEIYTEDVYRLMYATDASVYRHHPIGVAYPKNESDLVLLINFCANAQLPLIPRAGGTSLAGQVVGDGLVVDVSRHMNQVLHIDLEAKTATIQPGVIRDVLNMQLEPYGLFFGPNTSTSNRCNIGGMIGNNSCGTTSIKYGTTRDKIVSIRAITSDGEIHNIGPQDGLNFGEFSGQVMKDVIGFLNEICLDQENRRTIIEAFPKAQIPRRNTGYALDDLVRRYESGDKMNLARLLCGSEGTLAITSEAVIQLDPLPPKCFGIMTLEFSSIRKAMLAVNPVMSLQPFQCELMDDVILNCTKDQPKYSAYLNLLSKIPKGVLMVELRGESPAELEDVRNHFTQEISALDLAEEIRWHNEEDSLRLWELRKAGLGLLANLTHTGQAIACIEDTAVAVEDLPNYIEEFEQLMSRYDQKAVYYAHAGAGELHLRPILDLKTAKGREDFKSISEESANLVKKYKGSLSGEHGDGRVRASFIQKMVGEEVYDMFKALKKAFDPNGIFNPGKIVDALPIDQDLRYQPGVKSNGFIRFSKGEDLLGMSEKCNGSGDCRKESMIGGTMCPSYHATRNEKDTTRARANVLREVMMDKGQGDWFSRSELKEVMDLCLSCKGCKKECPSNVDMSLMKAEYLYQYHQKKNRPIRDYLMTGLPRWSDRFPRITKATIDWLNGPLSFAKSMFRLTHLRPLPEISVRSWYKEANDDHFNGAINGQNSVLVMCDEFTNHFDPNLGMQFIELLGCLGYQPLLMPPMDSGRAWISKGMLGQARMRIDKNLRLLNVVADSEIPIVGLEPSALLAMRDEWQKLCSPELVNIANGWAKRAWTAEEFLWRGIQKGKWPMDIFQSAPSIAHVHGHCHFKAQCEEDVLYYLLAALPGVDVRRIGSGCCGMAGGFGYEEEHAELSMEVAEQVLFPYLRKVKSGEAVIANGMSCRHQIGDGLRVDAVHPVSYIYQRTKARS